MKDFVTIYVAQILALVYLSAGIGSLFNKKYFEGILNSFLKNSAALYLAGILAMVLGFILVKAYSVWSLSWDVLITVFGWAALIKGITLIAFPNQYEKTAKKMVKKLSSKGYSAVVLAIGILFAYLGFFFK